MPRIVYCALQAFVQHQQRDQRPLLSDSAEANELVSLNFFSLFLLMISKIQKGNFFFFFFKYVYSTLLHLDSTVSEDAGIESRTVATLALTARRSNYSARSHPAE